MVRTAKLLWYYSSCICFAQEIHRYMATDAMLHSVA